MILAWIGMRVKHDAAVFCELRVLALESKAEPGSRQGEKSTLSNTTWDFNFQVSRHDHHNFEFKLSIDADAPGVEGRAEIFLFAPKTIKLSSTPRADILSDFHSRFRLSIPFELQDSTTLARALDEFAVALETVRAGGKLEHTAWLGEVQRFGTAVSEVLKRQRSRHKKWLARAYAHLPLGDLLTAVQSVCESAEQIEAWLRQEAVRELPYIHLLQEYLGHLFIQYLGAVDAAIQIKLAAGAHSSWHCLAERMARSAERITSEPAWRAKRQALFHDAEARAELLLRISQMKKFFQSNMFVEVHSRLLMKKVTEPVAAAAAGFAAVWATFFQQFSNPGYMRFGLSGLTFLSLGIAAYILKDRIKDRSKAYLASKAAKYFPDVEQVLTVDDTTIGFMREWFSVRSPSDLPAPVMEKRNLFRLSEAENHLGEDVLCYENQFLVVGAHNAQKSRRTPSAPLGSAMPGDVGATPRSWAVKSSVRINLDRYLKHLDDPIKAMTLIDPSGKFARLPTHRIYHFYVVVRVQTELAPRLHRSLWRRTLRAIGSSAKQSVYRVVMDKAGIQRVDRMAALPPAAESVSGAVLIPAH